MKFGTKSFWKPKVPLHPNEKTASCFCMFSKVKPSNYGPDKTPVYLNVYDLTPMNGYVYWAGLGIYHSGVEVHGVEYAYGAHELSSSGVFEVEPRQCPGFTFRRSIFLGTTDWNSFQVREFMERYSINYNGDMYHLITKNCNHFCNDICRILTGKSIPKWVNRVAKLGSMFNCVLPESLKKSAVVEGETGYQECENEKMRLRTSFHCLSSISMRQKNSSDPTILLQSSLNGCMPPLELRKDAV